MDGKFYEKLLKEVILDLSNPQVMLPLELVIEEKGKDFSAHLLEDGEFIIHIWDFEDTDRDSGCRKILMEMAFQGISRLVR